MALVYSGVEVQLREVVLRNKPRELIAASAKATVPVLVLPTGQILEESLAIIKWALAKNDPNDWSSPSIARSSDEWIAANDGDFKHWLDRYKYADRHPEQSAEWYRDQADSHLNQLNEVLADSQWLHGASMGISDIALFPFIRQFAMVDIGWFENSRYSALQRWLHELKDHSLFTAVMQKYSQWSPGEAPTILVPMH